MLQGWAAFTSNMISKSNSENVLTCLVFVNPEVIMAKYSLGFVGVSETTLTLEYDVGMSWTSCASDNFNDISKQPERASLGEIVAARIKHRRAKGFACLLHQCFDFGKIIRRQHVIPKLFEPCQMQGRPLCQIHIIDIKTSVMSVSKRRLVQKALPIT